MNNLFSKVLMAAICGVLTAVAAADDVAARRADYLARGMKTPETSKFFERHEDAQSHVVSWIIKPGLIDHNEQSFYFVTKSMTDDGRFLMFHACADELNRKVSHKKRLMLIDFLTDTCISLNESVLPFVDVKTDQIWYVKNNAIFRRDLLTDPLKAVHIIDIPKELWPTANASFYWVGHLTLTADRRKCLLEPDESPTKDFYEDSYCREVLLDLTDGSYEVWGEQNFWVNHAQLHPTNPKMALCAYEGCSKKWVSDGKIGRKRVPRPADEVYPRLLLTEPGRLTMIRSEIVNYATHEHWAEDGEGFYWCASGVHYADLATGRQTTICPLLSAHATMTADNRYVTSDSSWGGWWRGCGWTTLFWNRDTHRGIYIHSKRPVYAPQDAPSIIHPDPHPQFVCADRYVLCSMNVKDHQLTTSLTPVEELVRMTSVDAKPISPKRFSLEWDAHNDVSVPYEVTIDCQKLADAHAVAEPDCAAVLPYTAFAVEATVGGRAVPVPVEALPGNSRMELNLRFRVPAGTTALTGIADAPGRFEVRDSVTCDNLFAGAISAAAAPDWVCPPKGLVARHRNGILLSVNEQDATPRTLSYVVEVPAGAAGKPCKLELDVRSLSKMTWPNPIAIRQVDAQGKDLPEAVVDPRWTSHMRPPEKTCFFRETGRIHPRAKKLRIDFTLTWLKSPYDNHGLPLEDPTDLKPQLLVTRLALRPAATLPFPGWRDELFPAGVSGDGADRAIRLGGEEGFWYQTRSQASWAEARPMRDERQIFFPRAAGTVEAWFRPDWPQTDKGFYLFQASHHLARTETSSYQETRGDIFALRYFPATQQLKLGFIDWAGKKFAGEANAAIPSGAWTHVAVTWQPDGEAAIWLNGRKTAAFPLKGFVPFDLATSKHPNDAGPVEFYLGCARISMRASNAINPNVPAVPGAADLLRVSTGVRYAAPFTPAKTLTCDGSTRALFTFDRTFDGVSGDGWGFVPGSYRTLTDRRNHEIAIGATTVQYYPKTIVDKADPAKALHDLKYTKLPTAADFARARETRQVTRQMRSGDVLTLTAPKGVVSDFIEYANVGSVPVRYPMLVGKGEIDPRSFGDIADTLNLGHADDWTVCNRIFDLVLSASDYSQNHLATFRPGSDVPYSVEYEALMMLNAYCGFECGPLNNLAANLFATSGGCPAAQTAGYGHSFEEVFFNRKNHVYDLSARKFFPSMDNETVADLGDVDDEPYTIGRLGGRIGGFMRNGNRSHWVQRPSYQEKVGMVLNPGERFRMWRVNDGEMNDLQLNSCWPGNRRTISRPTCFFKSDAEELARAKCRRNVKGGRPSGKAPGNTDDDLARLDRFFPESACGYLVFDGRPAADNPAFVDFGGTNFAYVVKSGYPVVHAEYAAMTASGSAPLAISTDRGRTWSELPRAADGVASVDYPVRARLAYLIRVAAPLAEVTRFRATTTVQANRRLLPGELKVGKNSLTLRSVGDGVARVTVQYRVPAKKLDVKGGFFTGIIPGCERQVVLVTPGEPLVLPVEGASSAATAEAQGGLRATLAQGRLTLVADAAAKGGFRSPALEPIAAGKPYVTAVEIVDGAARKELTVIVASQARLVAASAAKLTGGAKLLPPAADRANACALLASAAEKVRFDFPKLPAGKYWVLNLTRYQSVLTPLGGHYGAGENTDLCIRLPGQAKMVGAGSQESLPDAYWWSTVGSGKPGARGNFKWEYACDPQSYYPYQLPGVFALPEISWAEYATPRAFPGGVELAAMLILPDPSRDFQRDIRKVLCGYTCEPWTCRAE